MQKTCLFCGSANPLSLEHIIPESLGNDDLILTDDVCASCNNYFAKVENYVLQKTDLAFWRTLLGIKTKKGNLPSVDVSQPKKKKGYFPNTHELHDNGVSFSWDDYIGLPSVTLDSESISQEIISGDKNQFTFVMTPKTLHELGRFLCKVGVELICSFDPQRARSGSFKKARNYARLGSTGDLWPIFHFSSGTISDLRRPLENGLEEVNLYEYSILEFINEYTLLRLKIGTSNWIVCLNDQWPTPKIKTAFPGIDINLIWYPKHSFENFPRQ